MTNNNESDINIYCSSEEYFPTENTSDVVMY